jgi:hypothetical protein
MTTYFWYSREPHYNTLMDIIMQTDEWKSMKDKEKQQEEAMKQQEEAMKQQEEAIETLQKENLELRYRLAIAEGSMTRNHLAVKKLEGRMNDVVSRSMRDNIIIKNMDEENNEDNDRIEQKIMGFLESSLNIPADEMRKITIERAHRIGQKNDGSRSRNIAVKMNSKGKTIVMKHLKNLDRNSSVKVVEQFPPEIHAARNKLWPAFVSAKQEGKNVRWNQDKLRVDGKLISPPSDRNNDINLDTTEVAMNLRVKHTSVVSSENSHYQGHTVKITSVDDVMPALKALCADTRVAGASNLMYAYRVGTEQYCVHNWDDDGAWGSARWIMDTIQKKSVYGHLVCVARWSSSQHLGRAHMDTIKTISELALQGIGTG